MMRAVVLMLFVCGVYARTDRIPISSLDAITLTAGRYTAGRRNLGVPQLKCVGRPYGFDDSYLPTTVQCINRGMGSNGDPQWECKADLDTKLRFGPLAVSCEGYDYPDDEYILAGSCGLEYYLEATTKTPEHVNDPLVHMIMCIVLVFTIATFLSFACNLFSAYRIMPQTFYPSAPPVYYPTSSYWYYPSTYYARSNHRPASSTRTASGFGGTNRR